MGFARTAQAANATFYRPEQPLEVCFAHGVMAERWTTTTTVVRSCLRHMNEQCACFIFVVFYLFILLLYLWYLLPCTRYAFLLVSFFCTWVWRKKNKMEGRRRCTCPIAKRAVFRILSPFLWASTKPRPSTPYLLGYNPRRTNASHTQAAAHRQGAGVGPAEAIYRVRSFTRPFECVRFELVLKRAPRVPGDE